MCLFWQLTLSRVVQLHMDFVLYNWNFKAGVFSKILSLSSSYTPLLLPYMEKFAVAFLHMSCLVHAVSQDTRLLLWSYGVKPLVHGEPSNSVGFACFRLL